MLRYPTIPVTVLLIVLVIPAIFANQITPHDPRLVNLSARLTPPMWQEGGSKEYILGTDKVGRDILSRIIYGSRLELLFAAVTVGVSTIIGTALGLTAGRLNGWAGTAIMRLVNIAPWFFAVLGLLAFVPYVLIGAILLTAVALVVKARGNVRTARAIITAGWRNRWVKLLANILLPIGVGGFFGSLIISLIGPKFVALIGIFTILLFAPYARLAQDGFRVPVGYNRLAALVLLHVGIVIFLECLLSFLGIGVRRPNPAWGLLVSDGRDLIISPDGWWVSAFPVPVIALTVTGAVLVSKWFRDRISARQGRRSASGARID